VVGGPQDLDTVIEKVGVGVAQRGLAADPEGDVPEADLTALRTRRRPRRWMLRDVERMKILAQVMNTPPCSGSSSAMAKPSASQ
jgi:hypothetical protein